MKTEHKLYKCDAGHLWYAVGYTENGETHWYHTECYKCRTAWNRLVKEAKPNWWETLGFRIINYYGRPASPLDVECPTCHAGVGIRCQRHGTIIDPHPERGKWKAPKLARFNWIPGAKRSWHRSPEKVPKYERRRERRKERHEALRGIEHQ